MAKQRSVVPLCRKKATMAHQYFAVEAAECWCAYTDVVGKRSQWRWERKEAWKGADPEPGEGHLV